MLRKLAGALADGVLPKTQAWLHSAVRYTVGEMRRPHAGGVSFMDHFLATCTTPGKLALEIKKHLLVDFTKLLQPERKGDLELEVHYYPPPMPGLSIGLYLIERDHLYEPVFERFNLDFAPEPIELVMTPVPPPKPPVRQPSLSADNRPQVNRAVARTEPTKSPTKPETKRTR